MFGSVKTKIYTVHVNPDKPDPADRVELVREGFSVWAFLFHVFWLLYSRLWLATLGYMAILMGLMLFAEAVKISQLSFGMLQLFMQVTLGFIAHDLQRSKLRRRGYALTDVVAAETELNAQRRYHDSMVA